MDEKKEKKKRRKSRKKKEMAQQDDTGVPVRRVLSFSIGSDAEDSDDGVLSVISDLHDGSNHDLDAQDDEAPDPAMMSLESTISHRDYGLVAALDSKVLDREVGKKHARYSSEDSMYDLTKRSATVRRQASRRLRSSGSLLAQRLGNEVDSIRRQPSMRSAARQLLFGRTYNMVVFALTVWVIFIDDIRIIALPKEVDVGILIMNWVIFAIFWIEVVGFAILVPRYCMSWQFWLDILAALSLIPFDALHSADDRNFSRLARASRVLRVIRPARAASMAMKLEHNVFEGAVLSPQKEERSEAAEHGRRGQRTRRPGTHPLRRLGDQGTDLRFLRECSAGLPVGDSSNRGRQSSLPTQFASLRTSAATALARSACGSASKWTASTGLAEITVPASKKAAPYSAAFSR